VTEATEEALPASETNEKDVAQESATVTEAAGHTPGTYQTFTERQGPQDSPSSHEHLPEKSTTVYVGNLFFDISESELVKEFTQFGAINRCKVIRDDRGLSKG